MSTVSPETPRPSDLPGLPQRRSDGHKGTFGTVAVIGGHADEHAAMIGAPALAATAALRAGCGLAKLVMPEPILGTALIICPSATGVPLPVDVASGDVAPHDAAAVLDAVIQSIVKGGGEGHGALAVGPGLGTTDAARAITLRAIQQEEVPVVLDADALNCLARTPDLFRDFHAAAVLTPHPGEFKRLCQGLGLTSGLGLDSDAPDARERACEQLAQRLAHIVVLKGAHTVVSDGLRTWTCPIVCPALATAGTGDVLTGLTAGLIAQFCESPQRMLVRRKVPRMPVDEGRPLELFDAARLAVWIHARAGQAWARQHSASGGLLAMELTELLPEIVEQLRS